MSTGLDIAQLSSLCDTIGTELRCPIWYHDTNAIMTSRLAVDVPVNTDTNRSDSTLVYRSYAIRIHCHACTRSAGMLHRRIVDTFHCWWHFSDPTNHNNQP
jgi:hypothetical protein